MNMKKTIAAIAAGAVAVSAMATSVSAVTLETRTLTYNLVKTVKEETTASVKLTAKFYNVPLEDGMTATFNVKNLDKKDIVRISGVYIEEGKQIVPIVATMDQSQSGIYSPATDGLIAKDGSGNPTGNIVVPVVATNITNGVALMGGDDENAPAAAAKPSQPAVTAAVKSVKSASIDDGSGNKVTTTTNITVTPLAADATTGGSKVTAVADGEDGDVELTAEGTTTLAWKDADGNTWAVTGTGIANAVAGDTVTVVYTAPKAAVPAADATGEKKMVSANITVEVTKQIAANSYGAVDEAASNAAIDMTDKIDNVNKELASAVSVLGVALTTTGGTNNYNNTGKSDITASDFNKATKIAQYPYRSIINNGLALSPVEFYDITNSGDVLEHIYEVKTDDTANKINSYNVKAVINDAIQNYGDVTFVFNTATKKVAVPADNHMASQWDMGHWNNAGSKFGCYVENDWDACNVADFRSFGNHYYNANQAGYDPNTTYILNNWINDNLFSGALLVNSNLTLSLDDTQKFDWTSTSLSFTWEAIQDAALTKNQYANYIQNMILRTSADWYWDNMQVILGETEVEEVESGAPVEGDVEDLPEDEEETDLGASDEEEEEEEEESEPEPEPEVAPAVESNPGTGNAPVALAVIPVALAAAAIVAKKRG